MKKVGLVGLGAVIILMMGAPICAQSDSVKYVPDYKDPLWEGFEARDDSLKALKDSITSEIRDRQDELKEKKDDERRRLRFDVSKIKKPESPEAFKSVYHFPPVAQYRSGTCWCFSTTSFLESEVARITGRKIKLSEMHTVYYEYLAKVRRFVRERGDSRVGAGAESNDAIQMIRNHGAVPLNVFPNTLGSDTLVDHKYLSRDIRNYLDFVEEHDMWDEDRVIAQVRLILNHYLGEPPQVFEFEGKTYTPVEFVAEVLQLQLDDYVSLISTLSLPFYTRGPLEVPDNWWYDSSYYNVPLNEWYGAIRDAIRNGYSIEVGGDNSEPGWNGFEDIAVVPDFDIPGKYINQHSREFRIYNRTTGDDHGLHIVGYTEIDGRDWYLIKDSGRSSRYGKYPGYYFWRDDYVRLKMLSVLMHRGAVKELLDKSE